MPFDSTRLRIERLQAEVGYHAAYNFWNLRGVMAERWAHGPIFGAAGDDPVQVTLTPPALDEEDTRLWGVYGLRGSGLNAEGEKWVPEARELSQSWISDAIEVLKPKRVVRSAVMLFALYPVTNIVQVSRRLRGGFYRNEALQSVLPPSLREERDRFHSAIDALIPFDEIGSGVSIVAGAVGPVHRGQFFTAPDEERDAQWWMGFRYERRSVDADGFDDPLATSQTNLDLAFDDLAHIAERVINQVLPDD